MPTAPDPVSAPADPQFALAELVPHMVWVARPDGIPLFVNRRWREYTGMASVTAADPGWAHATHPDDLAAAGERWAAALHTGEPYEVEFRLRRHDGEYRWHVSRGLPERDASGQVVRVVGTCTDIDAQRRAEDQLRGTEELFRGLSAACPVGIFRTDLDGNATYTNPRVLAILGVSEEGVLGHRWLERVHPDDAPAVTAEWARALAAGEDFEHEYRVLPPGGVRWVHGRAAVLRDAAGRPEGTVGTVDDVTDRVLARQAADAERRMLDAVLEALPAAVVVAEPDGRLVRVNRECERVWGPPPSTGSIADSAQWVGWWPATGERVRPDEWAMSRALLRGEVCRGEVVEVERFGGRGRGYIMNSAAPVRGADGSDVCGVAAGMAVTDRIRAEEARDRLAAIVDSSDDAILGLTPEGVVETWNPGAERLYGYAAAEAVGRSVAFLLPPDRAHDLPDLTGRLARGEPVPPIETVRLRKDGTRVDVSLRLSPKRDPTGRLEGYSAIARDISGRKQLEEQYRQAQKMEAVGRLAGGVAHDFNNLLTVINGYSEVALGALPDDHPVRPMVAQVLRAGERAAELTRQLLAYGRKQILRPQVLDLGGLVAGLGAMLRRLIRADITLTLDPGPARVTADPGQLEQVLMNLVVNAQDAMPAGGRLTVRTRGEVVGAGRYAVLEVEDTGSGMSEEVKARIFEPFFTTKGVGEGTGLGLAVVHGVVEQTGGHVAVESQLGRGTTFRVYLPAAELDPPASGDRPAPAGPVARGSETVLLVEDDDAVRALTMRALQDAGYVVADAASGEGALRVLAARRVAVDLLVTDVVMPGIGGRELAERLRTVRPGVRVLFMSGYTDDAVLRHRVEGDTVHFLQKPFTPAALTRKVREMLDSAE